MEDSGGVGTHSRDGMQQCGVELEPEFYEKNVNGCESNEWKHFSKAKKISSFQKLHST